MNRSLALLALFGLLVSCKQKNDARTTPAPSASASPSAPIASAAPPPTRSAAPSTSASAAVASDAGALAAFKIDGDAGAASTCRLVQGPVQQPFTGPATLVASSRGMEVVQHRNGIAAVRVIPVTPIPPPAAAAKSAGRVPLPDPAEKASRPPCAAAGRYAFCSDAQGNIHKSLREMASDDVIAKGIAGARLTAAPLGGDRTVLGYVDKRKGDTGEQFEAWAKVDGEPPVRISEDGSGASDVVFAARKSGEVVAWMIDARVSMTPVHMRVLKYGTKLEVGPDVVVHVAGGTSRFLQGALATDDKETVFGLVAASEEQGFGLLAIPLEVTTKEDAPFHFSPYPNGFDGAPLAATSGGKSVIVARVRPSRAPSEPATPPDGGAALPTYVLELGRLDAKGNFASLGLVPTQGSVSTVDTELDALGAVWLHYTDATGSWLERRVCP